ncbi:hypothetical protein B0T22DRAFT_166990 [Podospora appendiculata]|uniref:Uncharacterized protein n=1 Tax=Podospora appendiculata TaxID=314037 RepID=A0AAE1CD74_9PEZI|nr:hypothetical protein B0T22DRAFT_166990 [Podospora appendiculata]
MLWRFGADGQFPVAMFMLFLVGDFSTCPGLCWPFQKLLVLIFGHLQRWDAGRRGMNKTFFGRGVLHARSKTAWRLVCYCLVQLLPFISVTGWDGRRTDWRETPLIPPFLVETQRCFPPFLLVFLARQDQKYCSNDMERRDSPELYFIPRQFNLILLSYVALPPGPYRRGMREGRKNHRLNGDNCRAKDVYLNGSRAPTSCNQTKHLLHLLKDNPAALASPSGSSSSF